VLPAAALAEQFPEWGNLESIGAEISYRIENMKKISMEYRYYISSSALSPEQFASAVRGHWAIENSLRKKQQFAGMNSENILKRC
jgi:predicted transposase YbfD/YdcC